MTGRRLPAALALALLGLAGCGVPTSGDPTTIPASEIPYGLASETQSDEPGSPTETMLAETGIYLVTPEDILELRGRELTDGPVDEQLEELLGQLAAGPTAAELADQLSSSLPPEVELNVTEVSRGTATIDIAGPVEGPSGSESRIARRPDRAHRHEPARGARRAAEPRGRVRGRTAAGRGAHLGAAHRRRLRVVPHRARSLRDTGVAAHRAVTTASPRSVSPP